MFTQNSFKLAARVFKANPNKLSPTFWRSSPLRRFVTAKAITSNARTSVNNSLATLGLFFGAASTIAIHSHSRILNEAALGTINVNSNVKDYARLAEQPKDRVTSRFGGKLHYKQLSYGSLTGLFFGVVIGKLSSVLVFISLSAFLLVQVSLFPLSLTQFSGTNIISVPTNSWHHSRPLDLRDQGWC